MYAKGYKLYCPILLNLSENRFPFSESWLSGKSGRGMLPLNKWLMKGSPAGAVLGVPRETLCLNMRSLPMKSTRQPQSHLPAGSRAALSRPSTPSPNKRSSINVGKAKKVAPLKF